MKKTAIITGATAGIGRATAEKFAQHGMRLIITGRRKELLTELQNRLNGEYNTEVKTLCFDVRRFSEVEAQTEGLPDEWKDIDVLVNNAGLAVGLNPIHEGLVDDWERMIDTNVKGLLYVTRCIAPLMVARKSGHIINIGSIAGKEVYQNGNVYCATKHAVDALSKAMRLDMAHHGIKVTQICPGAVETEFSIVRFKGDRERADKVYEGFEPLTAADIADAIWYAVDAAEHVNVQDMLVMPKAQAAATVISKNN